MAQADAGCVDEYFLTGSDIPFVPAALRTAIGARKLEDPDGPGRIDVGLTLDLPIGQRTVVVATTFLPPGKPRVGDPIDAKLWRGQVTDVRLAGVTVSASSRSVTRFLYLADGAGLMVIIGILLMVGYAVDRRTGYA